MNEDYIEVIKINKKEYYINFKEFLIKKKYKINPKPIRIN